MVRTPWLVFLWVCALALYVVLGAANLHFGDLNQDEGWYLYAARQVHDGALPYRDFAFTQGPMLPFVYSMAQPLVDRWGVAGGRLFSLLVGFLGALTAAGLAARVAPGDRKRLAALLAFILIAGNVYQSYFTTLVKTYSLCAFFLAAGLLALSGARGRGGWLVCFLGGVLLALAAGTRISAGIAMPLAGLYLLFQRRRYGRGGGHIGVLVPRPGQPVGGDGHRQGSADDQAEEPAPGRGDGRRRAGLIQQAQHLGRRGGPVRQRPAQLLQARHVLRCGRHPPLADAVQIACRPLRRLLQ